MNHENKVKGLKAAYSETGECAHPFLLLAELTVGHSANEQVNRYYSCEICGQAFSSVLNPHVRII